MNTPAINYPPNLKSRIEQVLSEILSDKYDCKITLRFEKATDKEKEKTA